MENAEINDRLNDIAMWCEKKDKESKSDTKYYYWAQAIREAQDKMNIVQGIEDRWPHVEKGSLIGNFVSNVQYDTANRKILCGTKRGL